MLLCNMERMRKPQRHRANRIKKKPKFELRTVSIGEEDRPKLKAAMHEAALEAVAEFPKILDLVKEQLRQYDPVDIMACFDGYVLMTTAGEEG